MKKFNESEWNEYRKAHPEMRFFQALRNFCKVNFIWYQKEGSFTENNSRLIVDTFYIKDEETPKETK